MDIIYLIISGMVILIAPDFQSDHMASIEQWGGGTMISAHNYLAGDAFYDMQEITVVYSNGDAQEYVFVQSEVIGDSEGEWEPAIRATSSLTTLTFVTCYPRDGTITPGIVGTTGLYLVQMRPLRGIQHAR